MIRPASLSDLEALVELENDCFQTDRLSRRQFRHMLTRAHAETFVDEDAAALAGYALVLFRRGTAMARLYSIAVRPLARGRGLGRRLVDTCEDAALAQGCAYMRLEVRRDNADTIRLYERLGYRRIEVIDDYYEDHMQGLRYEKTLQPDTAPQMVRVPYYEQTLEFTCGASAVMMAMHALDADIALERPLELRIWREATTIFMTSGHGGCGPFGLALAAHHRGFPVEVYVNDDGVPLIDSVRSPDKKEVMRLVHEEMLGEVREAGIPLVHGTLSVDEMRERFETGGIPVVLISSYRIYGEKFPHWIVVTGFDERFVYAHDPYVDYEKGESPTDSINMPIARDDFARMARYGRAGLQAVLMIYPRRATAAHGRRAAAHP